MKKVSNKKDLNIVVQINGKKKGLVFSEKNLDEKLLIKRIKMIQDFKKYLDNK